MKPLEGVKVVELATYFAAPSCARLLADWGADVIKVESPKGDPYRTAYKGQRTPQFEEGCPSFDCENSNKKFIALDTKTESGRNALLKLVAEADVFITNNRLKALQKMRLTYEDLSEQFPGLVYADILGYGPKGPDKDKPGYDYTVFYSRSGFMADLSPKGQDVMNTIAGFGDHICGITLASGICAALYRKKTTGLGDHVSVSLYQTAIHAVSNGLLGAYYGRQFPRLHNDCNSPLLTSHKCKDGEWIYLSMPEYNKMFPIICEKIFDRPDLAADPRYNTIAEANKRMEEVVQIVADIFATQDSDYWVEKMMANDIAHEKVGHFKDVLTDEQAWANDYLIKYTYPSGDECIFPAAPVDFASYPERPFVHAGKIGHDTRDILKTVGYTDAQIDAMIAAGEAVIN